MASLFETPSQSPIGGGPSEIVIENIPPPQPQVVLPPPASGTFLPPGEINPNRSRYTLSPNQMPSVSQEMLNFNPFATTMITGSVYGDRIDNILRNPMNHLSPDQISEQQINRHDPVDLALENEIRSVVSYPYFVQNYEQIYSPAINSLVEYYAREAPDTFTRYNGYLIFLKTALDRYYQQKKNPQRQ